MVDDDGQLDALVAGVLSSTKYGALVPDLVRAVARRELAARRSLKAADKATRTRLHRVAAAYLPGRMRYDAWLEELASAREAGEGALRRVCWDVLAHHASTRERLPILETFFATTLEGIEPRSVLDVACGLNPLAIPWMPLAPGARYVACEVYRDLVAFLGAAIDLLGVDGTSEWRDVLHDPPRDEVDLALLLKVIPCLEQLDGEASARLLDHIVARHILVSFPVASLGGRDKGMVAHYDGRMRALLAGRPWRVKRHLFETELAFLLSR